MPVITNINNPKLLRKGKISSKLNLPNLPRCNSNNHKKSSALLVITATWNNEPVMSVSNYQ